MNAFEKVYKAVSKIPKGKIATYKQIARLTEINPRTIGFILSKNINPEKIPCHRVIGSNGELTGYAFGGVKKKKEMLKKEGITFFKNGRVDLKKHLFTF